MCMCAHRKEGHRQNRSQAGAKGRPKKAKVDRAYRSIFFFFFADFEWGWRPPGKVLAPQMARRKK